MFDKIVGYISNKKWLLILIVLFFPFFLIPFVAFILNLSLILGSFLPGWMILLRGDTDELVSVSTFIYYYTCFLAIEVTGILSYAVYQFSIKKESNDVYERNKERRLKHVRKIVLINDELQENQKLYLKERGNSKWSFYSEMEHNHFRVQFAYHIEGQEFKLAQWRELKGDLNIILSEINNIDLFIKMEYIYLGLNEIISHQDKNELDLTLFKNLNETLQIVKQENEKIINYLSYYQ
ncbi:hypothetical protein [Paenibacillus oryzisoli]|uniref:Uncharacterized protein n=1 Tax=Paenibacillus oryzisoli TaxID=1850517 RepID=A0A198AJH6_9BACL|nr:hypothetical protein [Paenibacillus oryzisoli]OAS21382.1 hypothetical protein A8708_31435 [Paenibacillus oryzisoli]